MCSLSLYDARNFWEKHLYKDLVGTVYQKEVCVITKTI